MKYYLKPSLSDIDVRIERGFVASDDEWGNGTPGGAIDENNYNYEI